MLTDTEITDHAAALGVSPAMLLPKARVRAVACPVCDAGPGQPCAGSRGPRLSHHIDRVFHAVKLNWPHGFGERA
jgi:hypothetical protein